MSTASAKMKSAKDDAREPTRAAKEATTTTKKKQQERSASVPPSPFDPYPLANMEKMMTRGLLDMEVRLKEEVTSKVVPLNEKVSFEISGLGKEMAKNFENLSISMSKVGATAGAVRLPIVAYASAKSSLQHEYGIKTVLKSLTSMVSRLDSFEPPPPPAGQCTGTLFQSQQQKRNSLIVATYGANVAKSRSKQSMIRREQLRSECYYCGGDHIQKDCPERCVICGSIRSACCRSGKRCSLVGVVKRQYPHSPIKIPNEFRQNYKLGNIWLDEKGLASHSPPPPSSLPQGKGPVIYGRRVKTEEVPASGPTAVDTSAKEQKAAPGGFGAGRRGKSSQPNQVPTRPQTMEELSILAMASYSNRDSSKDDGGTSSQPKVT